MIDVFLAGEGPNDIGSWHRERPYRDPSHCGVIETLLLLLAPEGWRVLDGIAWKNIRKFRPNQPGKAEVRNVLGAILLAKENGCHILAFTRDRDGSEQRQKDVERAMSQNANEAKTPFVIGGMAIEKLESWLLALAGISGSESERRPERVLEEKTGLKKETKLMVEFVQKHGLDNIPQDAKSLRNWLELARSTFSKLGIQTS